MSGPIDNSDSTIDSRDVIDRIRELENMASLDDDGNVTADNLDDDEREELAKLRALAEEGSDTFSDWRYGVTLVHEDYFEEYAQEYFTETDDSKLTVWPYTCIDWEQAASELQQDYLSIEFDGQTYWAR
jgi:hypothetical protein